MVRRGGGYTASVSLIDGADVEDALAIARAKIDAIEGGK
jgi:hypothetical protein